MLVASYKESAKTAAQFGAYKLSEWRPDSNVIVIAVSLINISLGTSCIFCMSNVHPSKEYFICEDKYKVLCSSVYAQIYKVIFLNAFSVSI